MKNKISLFIICVLLVFFSNGCKEEFPFKNSINAVTTVNISGISQVSANVSGAVNTDNGSSVFERGICYNIEDNPTVSNFKKSDANSDVGDFTVNITSLLPSTKYYARAYATNSFGTAYGDVLSFTTLAATVPVIGSTSAINTITQTSARSGGQITSSGASNITSKGVCWSRTNTSPTISDSRTNDGAGLGSYTSIITGLSPNTVYNVRAYATNSVGTGYGDVKTFTTGSITLPVLSSTSAVTSITQTTASSGGSVTSDGGSPIISRGVCYSNISTNPTLSNSVVNSGSGIGSFISTLMGLTPNTTYYVRSYAQNSLGTAYSTTQTFRTLAPITVGQSYLGGIVAYIYQPGDPGFINGEVHGLIATSSNQSTGVQWGCSGVLISGANNAALNTGQSNTTSIISGCTTTNIAARICSNLSFGGYTDWYLPSSEELDKLYVNRVAIGGFNSTSYWSSSQSNASNSISKNFSNGSSVASSKNSTLYVRAVRSF